MSKSVPLCSPLRKVGSAELLRDVSIEAGVSANSTKAVLKAFIDVVTRHLLQGEACNLEGLATFHLRRRDFSEERRAKFSMNNASLPEFSYYPYAEMSVLLRRAIAEHKYEIAEILSNVKTYRQKQEERKNAHGHE